ncbi:MAG: tetratricopeptide repeat protein [Myxococcales bacterium]|nr:tetratricopeptide repeat protein [Myxococcales bacterium]
MDDRVKQLLALGREHYEKREFDKAEHYLKQVVERGIAFADVFNMLGVIAHDGGELESARDHFESALGINPKYTEAALNLAVTYNDLGLYDEAKTTYQQAISGGEEDPGKLDPFAKGKIANLHAQTAQAYQDVGLLSEAQHELRKAVILCPHFADLRLRLANLYRQQGDLDAARFELKEALSHKPQYVPARVALGVVYLAQGDSGKALAEWQKALEDDPGNKAAEMYLRMAKGAATG